MADININTNLQSNSKNFPTTQTSISWHAAHSCTVTFSPSTGNCFGVASISFPPDDQTLAVVSPVDTSFTIANTLVEDVYDITFSNPEVKKPPKKKKKAKKPAAAVKKAAPAKKAKAKPKKTAKPKKAAKPKKTAKAKAGKKKKR
jgi:hypothetical protein